MNRRGTLICKPNADGSVRWYLSFRDGSPAIRCPDYHRKEDRPKVEAWRDRYVATMARLGATEQRPALRTVAVWFEAWIEDRQKRGLSSTKSDEYRARKHVLPLLGAKRMQDVTRRDIEILVHRLDETVRNGALHAKTARNVWGLVTKMCRDSCASKNLDLRVREDNPARDVAGPDRGVEREGPYLYPAEFSALIACPRVPPRWRRMIALGTYLGARRGELEALDWSAVNLQQRYVHLHVAVRNRKEKSTKTGTNRKVPIEPALLPLLEMMREKSGGRGRVLATMPPEEEMAKRLRRYLTWAGCTRTELHANDTTRRHMVWHDLRHTYASWRLIRGDHQKKVQRAGGWKTAAMLDRYANEVETFEDLSTFGAPFPALPLALFRDVDVHVDAQSGDQPTTRKNTKKRASPRGFEPLLAA